AARASVTGGATVREAGADGEVRVDVARAVAEVRPLPLRASEFALKELASSADRAERIALDDERRRIGRHHVASPAADLIGKRFGDAGVGQVGRSGLVNQLSERRN